MAHTKSGGSTSNVRDSNAQRLGIKIYGGEIAHPGNIIVKQRGTKFFPGRNVRMGKDDTIFATALGIVEFKRKKINTFTGAKKFRHIVSVLPIK